MYLLTRTPPPSDTTTASWANQRHTTFLLQPHNDSTIMGRKGEELRLTQELISKTVEQEITNRNLGYHTPSNEDKDNTRSNKKGFRSLDHIYKLIILGATSDGLTIPEEPTERLQELLNCSNGHAVSTLMSATYATAGDFSIQIGVCTQINKERSTNLISANMT